MVFGTIDPMDDNKKSRQFAFKVLKTIVPCAKRKAIAVLALKSGHTSRYVKDEVIKLLIDSGELIEDENENISFAPLETGELSTDSNGNHIPEKKK